MARHVPAKKIFYVQRMTNSRRLGINLREFVLYYELQYCPSIDNPMLTRLLDAFGMPPNTKIVLRTRLDSEIDNIQPWAYSKLEWNRLEEEPNRFEKAGAVRTSAACPVYNCHGLTFASRRTQVDWSFKTVSMILNDDGFVEIAEPAARLGDVAIYYDKEGGVSHSGIVVKRGDLNVPIIWSKWGKGYEMVHPLGICPYDPSNVKFYRIMKWKFEDVFSQNS